MNHKVSPFVRHYFCHSHFSLFQRKGVREKKVKNKVKKVALCESLCYQIRKVEILH